MSMWDVVQHYQIDNLAKRAALNDTQSEMHRAESRRRDESLEDDLNRVKLATEAMWSLVAERLGITMDDLVERMRALDAADGVVDGRRTPRPRPCPSCAAMVPPDRATCQFCGAATAGQDGFGPPASPPPPMR